MPKGPAGVNRPLVKTRLKYDVTVEIPNNIWLQPPKAIELLDMRVNSPQMDSNEFIKQTIGEVLLAVNRLAHPSRFRIIDEDVDLFEPNNLVSEDHVQATWTYVMKGVGIGEARNISTDSGAMWKAHEVLIKENDEHIKNAQTQREWNPSPYSVERVRITTE